MTGILVFDTSLRAGAGLDPRADFPAEFLRTGDPRQWGHYVLERRDIGLVAGIWQNGAFESDWMPFTGNEFFLVIEGEVRIEAPDGEIAVIGEGEAAVVPHGLRHRWIQTAPARLLFAKYTAPAGNPVDAADRIVKIDRSVEMPPSGVPAPEMLLSEGTPSTTEHTYFRTADGKMSVGAWTATPYHRRRIAYPRFELMHILEGETSFPTHDGPTGPFRVGETILVCKGTEAEWRNDAYIRKIAFNLFD